MRRDSVAKSLGGDGPILIQWKGVERLTGLDMLIAIQCRELG